MAQIASAQMQYELPQVSSPQSPGYWQNLPDAPTLNSTCSRRIDSDTSFWQTYITEAERYDKEIVDGWSRALDNLLVFSGLFSAVNTAFIIETYQLLQPDHAEDTANMFRLFLKHRHDDHQFTDEDLDFFKSSPRSAIRTNSLFFASLSCSLLVAIGAVQAKDWLTQYDHNGLAAKPLSVQARTRQKKFDGLERWRFRLFLAVLPLLLKIALGLFMFGVIFFLWEINNEVAGVVVAISLVGLLATVASWLIAVRYSTSPFQTPLSAHLHSPVTRSLARVSQIAHRVKAFSIVIVELQLFWLRWALRSWPSRQPGARWLNRFQLDVSKTLARMRNLEQDPSTGEISIERKLEDRTSAECIGWLFEQAEHEDVTLRTLNVASLLPPDHVLAAFDKRAGLLDRLATRYNTHVTQLVGRKRSIAEPEKALIAGIALFHLLKPQVLFTSRTSKLTRGTISTHRIRSIPIGKISGSSGDRDREGCLVMSQNADVEKVLAVVMCCIETLLPDSEGADETSFSDCFNYASESSNTPVTIPVPQSAGLSITLFPLNLLLDALIASAVRDIVKKAWRADWYTFYDIRKVLSHLKVVLDGDPTEETISHIAILIAVVQMIKHPEKRGEPGVLDKKLKDVLSAWYVVDKRSTVFRSIILAFDMADQVGPDDQDIKQVYLALLRYLDDYLPKDMEVSKKSGWATWWPNAMNLYPRVLGFLSQIKEEIPLDDVLRVFARLLPDDWQYNDIQEALQSRHTKETYPQVHALCPITFDESNAPDQKITVIGLIFQALKNTSGENLNPSPTVRDSIVELLGWLVAYPGASGYLPSLVQKYGEYTDIPHFLVSVIKDKEEGRGTKSRMEKEGNKMICRHAARHLIALAYMAPAGDPIVSEVKLRSLLHVFDRPDMISRWTGDRTSEIHPEEHFQEGLILQLVATPLKRFMKVKSDCEAGAHLVRDRALKEMMGVWSYIPRDSNSQHGHFLLQRNVIEKIIHYCENYSKRRDLASTDTEIVGPLVNYMQAAEGDEGLKDLHDRIAQVTESLENLRQPWYKAFFSSSSLAVGAAHGNISMGRQPEGSG